MKQISFILIPQSNKMTMTLWCEGERWLQLCAGCSLMVDRRTKTNEQDVDALCHRCENAREEEEEEATEKCYPTKKNLSSRRKKPPKRNARGIHAKCHKAKFKVSIANFYFNVFAVSGIAWNFALACKRQIVSSFFVVVIFN